MNRHSKFLTVSLAVAANAAVLVNCGGGQPSRISSIALPGNPVMSFPNSLDRVNTTLILSKPSGQVAGVDGRTFTITSVAFDKPQDQLTIDANGNMGLHGSYHSLSSRTEKKDIRPFVSDAIGLLDRTRIVTFRYRNEAETVMPHVGLVAEDAPEPLTDSKHRSLDLNNALSVTMAATHQLDARIRQLEWQVASLRSDVRALELREATRRRATAGPSVL